MRVFPLNGERHIPAGWALSSFSGLPEVPACRLKFWNVITAAAPTKATWMATLYRYLFHVSIPKEKICLSPMSAGVIMFIFKFADHYNRYFKSIVLTKFLVHSNALRLLQIASISSNPFALFNFLS